MQIENQENLIGRPFDEIKKKLFSISEIKQAANLSCSIDEKW